MNLAEAIRIRILDLMELKGFSQYEFYTKGGIAKSTVSQVLSAARERIAIRTIYEMTSAMDVPLKEFFDDPLFDNISD